MTTRPASGIAAAAGIAVTALVGWLQARAVWLGMSQSYDTLLYARSLWGIAHGVGFNPAYGTHWFGIHANFVLLLLAPAARLAHPAGVLIATQALAAGATTWLCVRASLETLEATAGTAVASLWGLLALSLTPFVFNPFLFDARPDLVAVPLLAAGFLRVDRRGWDRAAVALVASAALVREEFGVIAAVALVAVRPPCPEHPPAAPEPGSWGWTSPVARRARWGVGVALVGWFGVYWFGVRALLPDDFAAERAEVALSALFRPRGVAGVWIARAQLLVAAALVGGGLALRAPRWIGATLPGLAFVLLQSKRPEYALSVHYPMFAAPGLIAAAVAGLRTVPAPRQRRVALVSALTAAAAIAWFGAVPGARRFQAEHFAFVPESAAWQRACHALRAEVGAGGVAVAPMFGAPLADREVVFSTETLHRALADTRQAPDGLRWVLLDNGQWGTMGRFLVAQAGFQLVDLAGGRLALLERPDDRDRLPPILARRPLTTRCGRTYATWPEAGLALCDLRAVDGLIAGAVLRTGLPHEEPRPALALELALERGVTTLSAVAGLVDISSTPMGTALEVRSADRVRAGFGQVTLRDARGREYLGVDEGGARAISVAVRWGPRD